MKEKEYTESYEWKTIMLEFLLSILLLSLVSTITTLTKEENIFQWTECLSIGVSAFLIVFIGLHENRKVFQNTVKEYEEDLATDKIPVYRGHILSQEDLILRRHILNLMCQFHTSWEAPLLQFPEAEEVKSRLAEMEKDGSEISVWHLT